MRVIHSSEVPATPADTAVQRAVAAVSRARLEASVAALSFPRHFEAEAEANRRAGDWLSQQLGGLGLDVRRQGRFDNVIADTASVRPGRPAVLVGAHFDTVPQSPGADDNASAVAAMLECARIVSEVHPALPVRFVGFNREEDGLVGSRDYVSSTDGTEVFAVHVLEMLGFASDAPGSQRVPDELPIALPEKGDFIGIIGNAGAGRSVQAALTAARTYASRPALGLVLREGLELMVHALHRTDHVPFWMADRPACFWTDTADFRNPNYHKMSDTPDTLDYDFLTEVTRMLVATVLDEASTVSGARSGKAGPPGYAR